MKYYSHRKPGLSNECLNRFKNDSNLNDAAKRAFPILQKLNSKKINDKPMQNSILNFYSKEAVVPYTPISAQGPWMITNKGTIVFDVGGYGMLGFGHNPEWALKTLAKPHVMANVITPSEIHNDFTDLLKNSIGINRIDKKCPYSHFAFLNSGSEGMEFAMRLTDINKNKKDKPLACLVLEDGFHGRTYSASILSDSSNKTYKQHLKSYNKNSDKSIFTVKVNDTHDLHSKYLTLKNIYDIEAVVMEPVMGEGNPGEMLDPSFYRMARTLTKKYDSNFIIDSVQAGIRTNGYLSVVDYPSLCNEEPPDIEVFSKAVNAGHYPLSVIAVSNNISENFKTGIYGNTMSGNPKALEIASETLKRLTPDLINHIQTQGVRFKIMLESLKKQFPYIIDNVSGQGLLLALHIKEIYPVVDEENGLEYLCRKNGLNVIHGGKNALRFTPYFEITDDEIKLIKRILSTVLEDYTNKSIRKIP
jgi:acetylornithine/succinyldiaminopimelate/putrescine aminotransferase